MSWYQIQYSHGPGHQGHDVEYLWREERVPKDEEEYLFEEALGDYAYTSDSYGTVREMKKLPVEVHQQFKKNYEDAVLHAMEMQVILEYTPTTDVHRVYTGNKRSKVCICGNRMNECRKCHRTLCSNNNYKYRGEIILEQIGWCDKCRK